ncbi:hypothetical protein DRW03_33000 [Corallococcus sp. H22C18031201]|uniref:hypothetical protein n=1 Tax=Citreicoccus inhibens TaxID=2849499 RepID=UPI000E748BEE|nr:hypothetical protein [Citreicoccus inhibens]MBU8899882.1 hypothetical protein [Citreicoccus inhibens]RJS15640.1 hypothetical protein DRW03_33000 [Corallococcus sp. H22C18031201]
MRKVSWVLLGALAFSACKKDERASESQAAEAGAASRPTTPGESEEPRPYAVTPQKLDAYVGYQRRMLEVYGSLMRGLQDMGSLMDAGTGEARAGLKLIERKAKAEAEARQAAGLSEDDVNGIAEIVTAVISQRQMGRTLQFEEELKKLEALQARLPQEQRSQLAPQVDSMRRQVETFQKLPQVRSQFGDASVDAVLAREEDLTRNYQDMLKAFAGLRR